MGRGKNETAKVVVDNFSIVGRRGTRRDFKALDDKMAEELQYVASSCKEFEEAALIVDEALVRILNARHQGDRDDPRVNALAQAIAHAAVCFRSRNKEFSIISYVGESVVCPLSPDDIQLAIQVSEKALLESLSGTETAVNTALLFEEATGLFWAASAIFQATKILDNESQAIEALLPMLYPYTKANEEMGQLEGRFSEDDWADIITSSYKGGSLSNSYGAALRRQHQFGATTSHSSAGTQTMLEEMYAANQLMRDRVRTASDGLCL